MTTFLHLSRGLRTVPLLPLLFAAFTLTGCGGGDGSSTTTTSAPPPTPELSLAVQDIKTLRLSWTGTGQATGYRLFVETDASAARTAVATLPADTTQHDLQVFLPDQVNARYILQACNPTGCADVASANAETALLNSAVGYFKAATPLSRMGQSVALSSDGSTLAVGAHADDSLVAGSGAVYVFTRSPTGWTQQALLKAATPATGSRFGVSVALSSDGQRLAVGASGHDHFRGAIYIFERSNGNWAQQWFQPDPLPRTMIGSWREFGWSIALSGDGSTLTAGRIDGDYNVLVFGLDHGNWTSQAAIPATETRDVTSHALSADGNILAIGRDHAATAAGATGVVDIYERNLGSWSRTGQLVAPNAGELDGFGWSVAIAEDGQTIAVGAAFEDSDATGINGSQGDGSPDSGAVYVFARNGAAWDQQAYIKASNANALDLFGYAVSLSSDGHMLAVSAVDEASSARGLNGAQDDNTVSNAGAA